MPDDFDVDNFLARPLVARLATAGPRVRPIWFLWEDRAFWWLTGSWSRLADQLAEDASVALVVDTCDLATGRVRQVTATGTATIEPFDPDRARRKLVRYLGADEDRWDPRFQIDDVGLADGDWIAFACLRPDRLSARDLSFSPPG